MTTYVNSDTDEREPILCKFSHLHPKGEESQAAVALRGQWSGGDVGIDPVWVPVCYNHDFTWDIDYDTDEVIDEKYQLPEFYLETWWVWITRDDKDLVIGPYPGEPEATLAMEESLLVQGELEEGGTDCDVVRFFQKDQYRPNPDEIELVLIDLDNPDYTGDIGVKETS